VVESWQLIRFRVHVKLSGSYRSVQLQAVREAATICPHPVTLTFDLESGVWVTCDVCQF